MLRGQPTGDTATQPPAVPFYPQQPHIDIPDWSLMSEKKKISLFNAVLAHYREPGPLQSVLPRLVIPDTTNRGNTGLSVEHVHWVASKMQQEGFAPRSGRGASAKGHDLPIVVRESTCTEYGPESLLKWQRQLEHEPGFAPLRLIPGQASSRGGGGSAGNNSQQHTSHHHHHHRRQRPAQELVVQTVSGGAGLGVGGGVGGADDGNDNDDAADCVAFFGSLGNGHFFQALNLFAVEHPSLWKAGERYRVGGDAHLQRAVERGVPAVVLRPHITRRARKFLSEVLNSAFTYFWEVDDRTGAARINPNGAKQGHVSQFDALSKSLDSHELSSLITHALKKSRL